MPREQWSSLDFGRAMRRVVEAHSEKISERGDRLYFRPWWRDGKHENCVMSVSRGNWSDMRDGPTGGNAKSFAHVTLATDLPDMMKRYGAYSALEAVVPPPPPPPVDDLTEHWNIILDESRGARQTRDWLRKRGVDHRHLDDTADAVAMVWSAGMLPAGPACELIEWNFFDRAGPCAVFPLRDQAGRVRNLHLRPIGDYPKRLFLPGVPLRTADGPLGYGSMGEALECGNLLVCEGAFDTLAASITSGVPVVGAPSAGMLPAFAGWLRAKLRGEVFVLPQLDDNLVGQKAAARAVVALERFGVPARFLSWDAIVGDLPRSSVNDLGDVCRLIGSVALAERMRGLM